jgi:hypothetical protein
MGAVSALRVRMSAENRDRLAATARRYDPLDTFTGRAVFG